MIIDRFHFSQLALHSVVIRSLRAMRSVIVVVLIQISVMQSIHVVNLGNVCSKPVPVAGIYNSYVKSL